MMNYWALIIDGRVAEITDIDPADRFHPDLEFRPCPDDVQVGYLFFDGTFSPAPEQKIDDVVRAEQVRAQRNDLISQTDWVILRATELGQPVPGEWLKYRTALRDISAQSGFPDSIVWPTKPE